ALLRTRECTCCFTGGCRCGAKPRGEKAAAKREETASFPSLCLPLGPPRLPTPPAFPPSTSGPLPSTSTAFC
ncbi:hypothetical protein ETH_00037305, partial [Eimeria tenella]